MDIIKDRQYTVKSDALARRSAQTALHHVIEAMSRWIAPILSFTADEIWKEIPGKRESSVFVAEWYELPNAANDSFDENYWMLVAQVKTAVNKVIEAKRVTGEVGGALGAEVHLYCDDRLKAELQKLQNELRFVLITSSAEVKSLSEEQDADVTELSGLKLVIKKSEHTKCVRCWHYRADVGVNKSHPEICLRCVENIDGKGESRFFA